MNSELFSMLNMEDDEFDALFGPTSGAKNPFADEIEGDPIFSERGGKKQRGPLSRPIDLGI